MKSNKVAHSLLAFLLSVSMPLVAGAQVNPSPQPGENQTSRVPLWECKLPTGVFAVDLRTISSISTHEYLVDGGMKVTEVTVSPLGSTIARFYFAEPVTVSAPGGIGQSVLDQMQQKIKEGTDRLTGASGNEALLYQVIKKYPEATHAHTVEFRLKSREQATKVYESAYDAWRHLRPAKLTVE